MTDSPSGSIQYARVSPKERPRRESSYRRTLSLAAVPLLGSRLIFPGFLGKAVRQLLEDPASVEFPPQYARWYFGSQLCFEIDPARLTTRLSDFVRDDRGARWIGTSFLDGADWSGALRPIATSPIHREMTELVAADLDFRRTRSYRLYMHAIEIGRPVRRNGVALVGRKEIEGYLRYCVDLIRSVRKHGIMPRRQVRTFDWRRFKHRDARPPTLDSAERDIGVAINERGELIRHLGGKHRTAVAQALHIPNIPVELRLIHVGWLAEEMRRTDLPAHLALGRFLAAMRSPAPAPREPSRPQPGGEGAAVQPVAAGTPRKVGASAR